MAQVIRFGNGITLDVTADVEPVIRRIGFIPDKVVQQSVSRALKRATTATGKAASVNIRARYNIQAGRVKEAISVRQRGPQTVDIRFSSTRPTFAGFRPTQNKKGVATTIVKGQRKTVAAAFIPKGGKLTQNKYGTGLPVVRGTYSGNTLSYGKSRYPLAVLKTISVPMMLRRESVLDPTLDVAQKAFLTTFSSDFRFRISKL